MQALASQISSLAVGEVGPAQLIIVRIFGVFGRSSRYTRSDMPATGY